MTVFRWDGEGLLNPTNTRRRLISSTHTSQSVLTGAMQTLARPGTRWEMELTWHNVSGGERKDLLGFFSRLNGQEHRVRFPTFDDAPRGAWSGTPVINGASQTGTAVVCDGAPAGSGVTDYAKRGDYFRYDQCVRICTTDSDSDGSGNFTLNCMPPIRTSPADGTTIIATEHILGLYILMTPIDHDNQDVLASGDILSSFSLTFLDDVSG